MSSSTGAVDAAFVDTHVHFWDRRLHALTWRWLDDGGGRLGRLPALAGIDVFLPANLAAEARGTGLAKVVHVHAADPVGDPAAETAWLDALADQTGWPDAIVGRIDVDDSSAAATVERHQRSTRFRGVRIQRAGVALADGRALRLARHLDPGLVLHLDVTLEDAARVADLAERVQDAQVVVDHALWPERRDGEYLRAWTRALATIAAAGTTIKISGLGMGNHLTGRRWSPATLNPWLETCIEHFGSERVVFGTNWPVDSAFSSYADLVAAYRTSLGGGSSDDVHAMLVGNAERLYRI